MEPLERETMLKEIKELEEYLENFCPETDDDLDTLNRIKKKIHVTKWALHGRY